MSLTPTLIDEIFAAVHSHVSASGHFERVNDHEPKNAPGGKLTAAVWIQDIGPAPAGSGLAATTARIEFNVRVYQNMTSEPQDAIDPAVLKATSALIAAYSADFTLDGKIRGVDLLGQAGIPLRARAGYLNQDGQMMRVMTLTVPLIVNDAWAQTA